MHVDYGLVFYGFLILSGSVTVALCSDMGGYRRRAAWCDGARWVALHSSASCTGSSRTAAQASPWRPRPRNPGDLTMATFSVTYGIVTEESAEHGEEDENGFIGRDLSLRDAIEAVTGTRTITSAESSASRSVSLAMASVGLRSRTAWSTRRAPKRRVAPHPGPCDRRIPCPDLAFGP